ncbi:hypothetical protein P9112_004242 [Eukaryota sp. TZLM1-RC]
MCSFTDPLAFTLALTVLHHLPNDSDIETFCGDIRQRITQPNNSPDNSLHHIDTLLNNVHPVDSESIVDPNITSVDQQLFKEQHRFLQASSLFQRVLSSSHTIPNTKHIWSQEGIMVTKLTEELSSIAVHLNDGIFVPITVLSHMFNLIKAMFQHKSLVLIYNELVDVICGIITVLSQVRNCTNVEYCFYLKNLLCNLIEQIQVVLNNKTSLNTEISKIEALLKESILVLLKEPKSDDDISFPVMLLANVFFKLCQEFKLLDGLTEFVQRLNKLKRSDVLKKVPINLLFNMAVFTESRISE